MKLIFAGTHEIAVQFARGKNWKKHQWRYVQGPSDVAGFSDFEVYLAHGCFNSSAQRLAYEYAKAKQKVTW